MRNVLREEFEAMLKATIDPASFELTIEKDAYGDYISFYAKGLFQGYRLAQQKIAARIKEKTNAGITAPPKLIAHNALPLRFEICGA